MSLKARLSLFAFMASCTAVPPGVVSVEARGGYRSEPLWVAILQGLGSGTSSGSASSDFESVANDYSTRRDEGDGQLLYGLRAAVSTPVVDLVGGVGEQWFDDRGAGEVSFGIRKRFGDEAKPDPDYFVLLARHGSDLRTDRGHEDYDGVSVGVGSIHALGKHWFVDVSLEAEWLTHEVELDGNDTHLFGLMLEVGLGFSP